MSMRAPDCAPGYEGLPEPIDVIVPLTYTTRFVPGGPDGWHQELSQLSEWSIDAALHLQDTRLPNSRIIIAGERTFGRGTEATGTLMAARAASRSKPIEQPVNQMRVLTRDTRLGLRDTPSQFRAIDNYLGEGVGRLIIVGMSTHVERAGYHAQGFGLNAETAIVEDVLSDTKYDGPQPDPDMIAEFEDWQEQLARRLAFWNKKGTVLHLLSLLNGTRLQDVVVPDDESQEAVNTTVRSHLKENPELNSYLKSRRTGA